MSLEWRPKLLVNVNTLLLDGVWFEPVSEFEFPANREKYREICDLGP